MFSPHGVRTRMPALRSQTPYRYANQLARFYGFEFSCHLAAAARIEVNNIRVLWFFSVYKISRPN